MERTDFDLERNALERNDHGTKRTDTFSLQSGLTFQLFISFSRCSQQRSDRRQIDFQASFEKEWNDIYEVHDDEMLGKKKPSNRKESNARPFQTWPLSYGRLIVYFIYTYFILYALGSWLSFEKERKTMCSLPLLDIWQRIVF